MEAHQIQERRGGPQVMEGLHAGSSGVDSQRGVETLAERNISELRGNVASKCSS